MVVKVWVCFNLFDMLREMTGAEEGHGISVRLPEAQSVLEEVAQLTQRLPSVSETLNPSNNKPDMVAHTCDPSTCK